MYLDDGLGGNLDPMQASDHAELVRKDLLDAGFLLSDKKCFWLPDKKQVWLGHNIDMEVGNFSITSDRVSMLKAGLSSILSAVDNGVIYVEARVLARSVGRISSMHHVWGIQFGFTLGICF